MSIKVKFELYVNIGEVLTVGRSVTQVPAIGEWVVHDGWKYRVNGIIWKLDSPYETALVTADSREGYYE